MNAPAPVINIGEHQNPVPSSETQRLISAAEDSRPNEMSTVAKASTVDKTTTVVKTATVAKTTTEGDKQPHDRRYKVHKCERVQDAHSSGENILYGALWQAGRIETESTRMITMGWDMMAKAAGMSDKAAKRNLSQLISKLAIEQVAPEDSHTRTGRTYRIFSFKPILERRRASGLTHVIRDKGVRFVTENGEPVQERSEQNSDGLSTVDVLSTVDNSSPDTVDKTSTDTVDKTSTPLGSYLGIKTRKATTTSVVDVSVVAGVLCQYFPGDRAAAARIVESAQATCPDCTTEDVVSAIRRKAMQLQRQDGIKSPVGLLITSCGALALAARNERVATEASQAEEAAGREHAQKEAAFLASLDGLPNDNQWRQILGRSKDRISTQSFDTWLRPTRFAGIRARALQVYVPSPEFKCVGEKYADHFSQAIRELGLDLVGIEFLTSDEFVRQREESGDDC